MYFESKSANACTPFYSMHTPNNRFYYYYLFLHNIDSYRTYILAKQKALKIQYFEASRKQSNLFYWNQYIGQAVHGVIDLTSVQKKTK